MLRILTLRSVPQGINIARSFSSKTSKTSKPEGNPSPAPSINSNVPGLSENCVKIPSHPVGPGASKDKEYKNPEYFCYNADSFAEAEVELAKYRLPAPSNKVPFKS